MTVTVTINESVTVTQHTCKPWNDFPHAVKHVWNLSFTSFPAKLYKISVSVYQLKFSTCISLFNFECVCLKLSWSFLRVFLRGKEIGGGNSRWSIFAPTARGRNTSGIEYICVICVLCVGSCWVVYLSKKGDDQKGQEKGSVSGTYATLVLRCIARYQLLSRKSRC